MEVVSAVILLCHHRFDVGYSVFVAVRPTRRDGLNELRFLKCRALGQDVEDFEMLARRRDGGVKFLDALKISHRKAGEHITVVG